VPSGFYASQSAKMSCYFTCQKLSKFFKTCFTTTKETALAPLNLAHRGTFIFIRSKEQQARKQTIENNNKQTLTRRWHVTISCQPDGRPP